jgi:integrase
MPARRRFGSVRRLPSGRWQGSYVGPDGIRRSALATFKTKTDAGVWLSAVETDLSRGDWFDSEAATMPLLDWLDLVLDQSPTIGDRWRETCRRNMRLHLVPLLDVPLRSLSPTTIRQWHATAIKGTGGRTSIAQSYRFLHMALNVAVDDGVLQRNPCRIKGAGTVKSDERPTASPAELVQLVEAITPAKYRAAVVIGGWVGLRRGEIVGLRRADVDLDQGVIFVRQTRLELLETPVRKDKDPKTRAGRRQVAIPPHVLPMLQEHMQAHAGADRVFIGSDGEPLRGHTLYQAFVRARARVGLDHLRFHDLRHTGQTLAAQSGATMADLMLRLGHSTPAAARRYLHTVEGRDHEIAKALSRLAEHGNAARLPERPADRMSHVERTARTESGPDLGEHPGTDRA